jgi:hypothetical protein
MAMSNDIRFAIEHDLPSEIIVRENSSRALLSARIVAREIGEVRVIESKLDADLFDAAGSGD